MLVCKINYAELDKEKGIVDKTAVAVVASTKGKNALVDAMKQNNQFEKSTTTQEIFVDKTAIEKALTETIAKQYPNHASLITAHAIKALDGACMFKRPKGE